MKKQAFFSKYVDIQHDDAPQGLSAATCIYTGVNMKMHFLGLLLILLTCSSHAQDRIACWSVETQNNKVYLMGSVHLLKEKISPYPERIEKAFSDSHILLVEAYIGSKNMVENAEKLMSAGTFPDGQTLKTVLSPSRYGELSALLSDLGYDVESFIKLRPWMTAMTVSSLSMLKQGYQPMNGVDVDFMNRAEARGMGIEELEGVDYQVNLFKNMSPEEEEAFLFSSLTEQKEQQNLVDDLVSAWKKGDLEKLTSMIEQKDLKDPDLKTFYNSLLYNRNKNMTSIIEKGLLSEHRYFVIIGAAHLLGKKGIIELLRQKGYRITLL